MHDTNTRGGLVHRWGCEPRPVGLLGDAVEGDIASGVPAFDLSPEKFNNLLIYMIFIFT